MSLTWIKYRVDGIFPYSFFLWSRSVYTCLYTVYSRRLKESEYGKIRRKKWGFVDQEMTKMPLLDLRELFWQFCEMAWTGMPLDELRNTHVYQQIWQMLEAYPDGVVSFVMPFEHIWGCVWTMDDICTVESPMPEDISSDGEKVYFRTLNAMFYGLADWYTIVNKRLRDPWVEHRAQVLKGAIQRCCSYVDILDLADMFADATI